MPERKILYYQWYPLCHTSKPTCLALPHPENGLFTIASLILVPITLNLLHRPRVFVVWVYCTFQSTYYFSLEPAIRGGPGGQSAAIAVSSRVNSSPFNKIWASTLTLSFGFELRLWASTLNFNFELWLYVPTAPFYLNFAVELLSALNFWLRPGDFTLYFDVVLHFSVFTLYCEPKCWV